MSGRTDQNPYQAPEAAGSDNNPSEQAEVNWAKLVRIAKAQRSLCRVFVLAGGLSAAGMVMMQSPLHMFAAFGWCVLAVAALLQFSAILNLVTHTYNAIFGVFVVILAIIPLMGLAALLIASGGATDKLKAAGVRVGLMGTPYEELERLEYNARKARREKKAAKSTTRRELAGRP